MTPHGPDALLPVSRGHGSASAVLAGGCGMAAAVPFGRHTKYGPAARTAYMSARRLARMREADPTIASQEPERGDRETAVHDRSRRAIGDAAVSVVGGAGSYTSHGPGAGHPDRDIRASGAGPRPLPPRGISKRAARADTFGLRRCQRAARAVLVPLNVVSPADDRLAAGVPACVDGPKVACVVIVIERRGDLQQGRCGVRIGRQRRWPPDDPRPRCRPPRTGP